MSPFSFFAPYSAYLWPFPVAVWLPMRLAWVRSASEHLRGARAAHLLRWLLLMRDAAAGEKRAIPCVLRHGAGLQTIRRVGPWAGSFVCVPESGCFVHIQDEDRSFAGGAT